jgi:hypothetical protein
MNSNSFEMKNKNLTELVPMLSKETNTNGNRNYDIWEINLLQLEWKQQFWTMTEKLLGDIERPCRI